MQLPLSQGQHDSTPPLPTHRAITPLASLFCSDAHDEHSPDKFSRSIGRRRPTISIRQINAERWHVVHGHAKGTQRADLPPDPILFPLSFCGITLKQVMHSRCQYYLGRRKRNYSCTAWKTFSQQHEIPIQRILSCGMFMAPLKATDSLLPSCVCYIFFSC